GGHINIKARETLGTRYTVHVKMLPHDQHTQVEERLLDDVSVIYIFRGTPLYVQLLVFYSGMYTLEIVKGTDLLNAFFRSGLNCT
ncbi:hypothetical protein MJM04_28335, partial [Salmonella enterica subsp. enterica serovar Cerro]|nr:hypothetical protein [Salmonella enterica subsp. enterica serovar Cerro]